AGGRGRRDAHVPGRRPAVRAAPGPRRRSVRASLADRRRGIERAASRRPVLKISGGDLLSREVALRVPSALAGLTSLFGMGRGVPLPVRPPKLSKARTNCAPSKLHSSTLVFKIKTLGQLVRVR